ISTSAVCQCIMRIQRNRHVEVFYRSLEVSLLPPGQPAVAINDRSPWPQFENLIEVLNRLVVDVPFLPDKCTVIVSFRVLWIQSDRFSEVLDGTVVFALV